MKKSTRRLTVRHETLRALVAVDLTRVVAGDDLQRDTSKEMCTALVQVAPKPPGS
jgi:hypothetical protein